MRGQPPGGGGVGLALTLCCLLVRGPPLTHPHSPRAGTQLAPASPLPLSRGSLPLAFFAWLLQKRGQIRSDLRELLKRGRRGTEVRRGPRPAEGQVVRDL